MKKGEASRAKLVEKTGDLLRRQGYHATGLAQIVEESGAPRGSVYFYFPGGKEELACEALALSGSDHAARLEAIIEAAPDPGAAAEAVCKFLADELVASRFRGGCPIATVALEASTASERARKVCAAQFSSWEKLIAKKLVAAGVPEAVAETSATFVLSTVEGATLLAKTKRDPAPLQQAGVLMNQLFQRTVRG